MLNWLKEILGDQWTADIDKQVSVQLGKNFVSKSDFDAKNEAYKGLQAQLGDRDKQLEELKKVDAAGLKAQIEKLQGENKAAKETYEKQLGDMRFDYALNAALSGAKIRNPKAAKALLDAEKLKLDGGQVLGLDDQLAALRESDGYLFEPDKAAPAFAGPTPGANTAGGMDAIRAAAGLKIKTD